VERLERLDDEIDAFLAAVENDGLPLAVLSGETPLDRRELVRRILLAWRAGFPNSVLAPDATLHEYDGPGDWLKFESELERTIGIERLEWDGSEETLGEFFGTAVWKYACWWTLADRFGVDSDSARDELRDELVKRWLEVQSESATPSWSTSWFDASGFLRCLAVSHDYHPSRREEMSRVADRLTSLSNAAGTSFVAALVCTVCGWSLGFSWWSRLPCR
jgi:hypothetical protein